jgi:3-hydroxyisobutyrate dehydrogenase-like beta-hydroxyacid dehydrogenase
MKTDGEAIGLFGLGNMGMAIASRLCQRFDVVAYDPDPARQALGRQLGARTATGSADVGAACRRAVLSLPRPAVSTQVIVDLLADWGRGGLVVETSTITPADARSAHASCLRSAVHYVDAAILSGVGPVSEGTSTLLIGADDDALAAAGPVLDAICPTQKRLGPPGAGMAAKVINNAVAHAVYVVLAEAVAMAGATGVSMDDLVALLGDPDAGLLRPLTHRIGERLRDRNFSGGMATESAYKDSTLALELAQANGIPLFAVQAAHTAYEIAMARGMARQDYSVLATLWEEWTGRDPT